MANSKGKTRRKIIIFSIIGVVIAGLSVAAYYRKREVPITVQTEKVTRRNLTELVIANGKIQPVVQVVINPEVSGEIIELPVKEGQSVKKGDLLVKIKPDNYKASLRSAEASYQSSLADKSVSKAELLKAELEYNRNTTLFSSKLVSESIFLDVKTAFEVATLRHQAALHQTEMAQAARTRAEEDLAKTTIVAPMDGTVTKLRSQRGERVVGTAMMAGTEIMTVANLDEMEARVDIGEIDIVLIAIGQKARLEVDAFRDRKFSGVVSEIANASKGLAGLGSGNSGGGGGQSQEATKFEVKIRVNEGEVFRPGMSVTAEVETRYRTNVLTVPIQSITTRIPKPPDGKDKPKKAEKPTVVASAPTGTATDAATAGGTNSAVGVKKANESPKPVEVVFLMDAGKAKMARVKAGISDDSNCEILDGLSEGQEVISGGYKAISRELEDGKAVKVGPPKSEANKDKK